MHRESALQGDGRPLLVWRLTEPARAIATTVLGGGLGDRTWLLNAQVAVDYRRADPGPHLAQVAASFGLPTGEGIGCMTAVDVREVVSTVDGGVTCDATVGLSTPTWAAAPDGSWSRWQPGTINLVCWVPAPLDDAALANALVTATEAKVQALVEAGVPGTGTASDAVAICCPRGGAESYGGPRSRWGARLARAVRAAVSDGTARFLAGGMAS